MSDVAPASDGEQSEADQKNAITVEKSQTLYALLFDSIDDIGEISNKGLENVLSNLDPQFCKVSSSFYRLKCELLMVLGVDKVFELLIEFR